MDIQLSDHFTLKKLLRFAAPSIWMMIFTSIYSVVDGFFVSNFVGKSPFAAVNFIMPFLMILGAVGSMLGTGGSALVAITLGQGDRERANRLFSLFIYATVISGAVLAVLGIVFLRPIAVFLGANGEMLEGCVLYGRWILPVLPVFMLQYEFQSFFVTAEKPKLGLAVTVGAGLCNIVLDALLVAVLRLGLPGAAAATAVSQLAGGVVPVLYFWKGRGGLLRLGKTSWDGKAMKKACSNGSSEFISNISMSLVSMLYNYQLIRYAGEDGVAAYGVLMYVAMIFLAVFIGFSVGTAPIVGFHFGAEHKDEVKGLLRMSLKVVGIFSVLMFLAGETLALPLARLFVGYDASLQRLTLRAFTIYSFSFLFVGVPIYGSSFFTALNDGVTSAAISFLRTVVFEVAAVLTFPLVWGIDGVWFSTVATEVVAALLTIYFWVTKAKKYGY